MSQVRDQPGLHLSFYPELTLGQALPVLRLRPQSCRRHANPNVPQVSLVLVHDKLDCSLPTTCTQQCHENLEPMLPHRESTDNRCKQESRLVRLPPYVGLGAAYISGMN